MTNKTYMDPPVHLRLPRPTPKPVQGCSACFAFGALRAAARARGDLSRVSDCNVEIENHPDHGEWARPE
ncbi:hypothetical protein [Streptomyces sp. NPDC050504]|uniref:hypothetical protein n=1 Tax=Streptomyces sp. NPDC050504 TaxID=3365618 RepID=UPI00379EB264